MPTTLFLEQFSSNLLQFSCKTEETFSKFIKLDKSTKETPAANVKLGKRENNDRNKNKINFILDDVLPPPVYFLFCIHFSLLIFIN